MKLNEVAQSNALAPWMFQTREEIDEWIQRARIQKAKVNKDLTIDVKGRGVHLGEMSHVFIQRNGGNVLPVQFGKVDGDFLCPYNKLTSLVGVPYHVGNRFSCLG